MAHFTPPGPNQISAPGTGGGANYSPVSYSPQTGLLYVAAIDSPQNSGRPANGYFSAFDAGTGDLRWRHDATGGISGAPTVMAGLVYYSTFGTFTNSHQRHVKDGPYRTYALDARTGEPVWQFPDGQYSPIVADPQHVYLVGSESVYGLVSRSKR